MEGIVCYPPYPTGKIQVPPEPNRVKIPKDGMGARGFPDCYYTSRVLNSTFRYARFVKQLRAKEEELRVGEINTKQALKDVEQVNFFARCDRKSMINRVERRVNLCLESYERDLEEKRKRLRAMIFEENQYNTRKLVEQAQAGREILWQEKLARLDYLLKKRAKEHADKYKDTPLSKFPNIGERIRAQQAKQTACCHLFQMKEKRARKEAEKEFDMMWHEIAMREADALAARMEIDAIAQKRREMECKAHADMIMEVNKQKREAERERLKQETLWLKSIWEEDNLKEEEAQRLRQEKVMRIVKDRNDALELAQCVARKKQAEDKLIQETWDSMAGLGLAAQAAEVDLIRRKRVEQDTCNRVMIDMRDALEQKRRCEEPMFEAKRQQIQHERDLKRCEYEKWRANLNREAHCGVVQQIRDKVEREKQEKLDEAKYLEYLKRTDKFGLEHDERPAREAKARQQNLEDLLEQIKYNHLLKEREIQEEKDQLRKFAEAKKEYEDEMDRMVRRPFLSEGVHPFMKEISTMNMEMRKKCPCSKPDYCKTYNETTKKEIIEPKNVREIYPKNVQKMDPKNVQGMDDKNEQCIHHKNVQNVNKNVQEKPN